VAFVAGHLAVIGKAAGCVRWWDEMSMVNGKSPKPPVLAVIYGGETGTMAFAE
jgi:hypothetical protein